MIERFREQVQACQRKDTRRLDMGEYHNETSMSQVHNPDVWHGRSLMSFEL